MFCDYFNKCCPYVICTLRCAQRAFSDRAQVIFQNLKRDYDIKITEHVFYTEMALKVFYAGRKYRVLGSRINHAKNSMGQKYINTNTGQMPLSQLPDNDKNKNKNDDKAKKTSKPVEVEPLSSNYAE